MTSRKNLKKIKTNELRSAISKKSKVDENEIFVDSSVTPSIPLAPSKNESKSIILITNEGGKSSAKGYLFQKYPWSPAISELWKYENLY